MTANDNRPRLSSAREALAKYAEWIIAIDSRLATSLPRAKREELETLKRDILAHRDAMWRYHYDPETVRRRNAAAERQGEAARHRLPELGQRHEEDGSR